MNKFELNSEGIQPYFDEHGYVVIKQALSDNKIDKFISAYERVKSHPMFVYYAQSINGCARPTLNEHSYIKESMQNASRLAFFKAFADSFKHCIYDHTVSQALSSVSGAQTHISWQNMFFDQSTGTVEHQDSWYLDTEPAGDLIGVWYALEDIHADSGPFFVIPGSHKIGLLDRQEIPDHDDFVETVREKVKDFKGEQMPMCLEKGDILLWHPYLIHGAFDCSDPSKSRKSFTSHFYPSTANAKDTESGKLLSIYNHSQPKPTFNPNISMAYRFNDYFYNMLVYGLFVKDRIKKGQFFSMRREDYA